MANSIRATSLVKARVNIPVHPPTLTPVIDRVAQDVDPRLLQLKPKKLPPTPKTRDLLQCYGIVAKKNLSQNFLLNPRVINSIVRAAGIAPGHRVVEVGPGPGNITRKILERSPFELLTIEKDRRFLPLLEQLVDSVLPGQMKVLLGDALDHDFNDIFGNAQELISQYKIPDSLPDYVINFSRDWNDPKYPLVRIIGNLPFSVAIPMLLKWLNHISYQTSFWQYGRVPMLLTFQDEVARRICAEPASFERTRLSLMSQNYCHVDYKFTISGNSFTPTAGVNTGVVRFSPRIEPFCKAPFRLFEKFVRHLYHHRNHDILYNFKTLYPKDMRDNLQLSFGRAHVDSRIFPYMISNREAARLCNVYHEDCQAVPALIEYDYRASAKLLDDSSLRVLKEAGLDLLNDR